MNIKTLKPRWEKSEIEILKNVYPTLIDRDEILNLLPNRNWNSITLKASYLKIKTNLRFHGKTDIHKLLEENNESYYWIGFLMADGSVTKNNKRITIHLAEKDKKHLSKLASYLKCTMTNNNTRISIMDTNIVPKIVEKFDMRNKKTFYPPNSIKFLKTQKQFWSFLTGFIDGDGNIVKLANRKHINIRIKLHSSWLRILKEIRQNIIDITGDETPAPYINNSGYALLVISNGSIVVKIKKLITKTNTPCMDRKWSQIDENFVSKYEITQQRIKIIKKELISGSKQTDIAKKIGIGDSAVFHLIKKYNLRPPIIS